jgi:hypothetical protein
MQEICTTYELGRIIPLLRGRRRGRIDPTRGSGATVVGLGRSVLVPTLLLLVGTSHESNIPAPPYLSGSTSNTIQCKNQDVYPSKKASANCVVCISLRVKGIKMFASGLLRPFMI